jgi:hypothetical protein
MHINELTAHQTEQEIGIFSEQLALAQALGMGKAAKQHKAYLQALWAHLNAIKPIQKISEDELLAELFT